MINVILFTRDIGVGLRYYRSCDCRGIKCKGKAAVGSECSKLCVMKRPQYQAIDQGPDHLMQNSCDCAKRGKMRLIPSSVR